MSANRRADTGLSSGQVITFYSYKGGTGRSMALANVAVLLAGSAEPPVETLMIDWDLEAPGLHKYFPKRNDQRPMADPQRPGLADLFSVLFSAAHKLQALDEHERRARVIELVNSIDLEQHISATDVTGLHLLKAGRLDDGYSDLVNRFRWDEFYDWAPWAFRALTERLIRKYRYVLVDSRTGITDTSSICTSLLPDKLVVVFTPNEQSLDGVRELVDRTVTHRHESDDLRPLIVYPLPSRIEEAEPMERDAWRLGSTARGLIGWQRLFESTLADAYEITTCNLSEYFDNVQIRHNSHYAYGEKVAVRIDRGTEISSLPQTYARFVRWLVERASPWESEQEAAARQTRALGRRVESVFLSLPSDVDRERARRMFTRLVQVLGVQQVGDFALRIAKMEDFAVAPEDEAVAKVIGHFEDHGLLRVTRTPESMFKNPDNIATVQLSDALLLTAWPRLREWIEKDRQFLLWRQRLDEQIEAWQESEQDPSQLLRGNLLVDALGWVRAESNGQNRAEQKFIAESERHEDAVRRGRIKEPVPATPLHPADSGSRTVLQIPQPAGAETGTEVPASKVATAKIRRYVIAAGLLLGAGIAAFASLRHSNDHADVVVAAARVSSDPAQAALLLASLDDKDSDRALDRAREIGALRLPSAVLPIPGTIATAALNARGTNVLVTTTDGSAWLRSVQTDSGRLLKLPVSDASRGGFSPDGRALLISRRDGSLVVLSDTVADDARSWTPGRILSSVSAGAQTAGAARSADRQPSSTIRNGMVGAALISESTLLAIDRSGSFTHGQRTGCCTWSARSGSLPVNNIVGAAFSADGSTFAIDVAGRGLQLWSTRALSRPIATRTVSSRLFSLSASGNYVGIVTQDSTALVWDQIGPTIWQQQLLSATSLAVDAKGERVALSSGTGRTLVLPIRPGTAAGTRDSIELRTPGPVTALMFGSGSTLVTAADSTLRIWQLDRALPSASASWLDLRKYFASTDACLSAQDRQTVLGESASAARKAYDLCASRLGLVAEAVIPLVGSPRPGGPQGVTVALDSNRPATTPLGAPNSGGPVRPPPSPTIDLSQLLDGDEKTWTGEWTRGDGSNLPIQFTLRLKGETALGRVRWVVSAAQQPAQRAVGPQINEGNVVGTFNRRRMEILLRAEKAGPTDPAEYRLLIIDRTLQLRGTISTTDSLRTPVHATYDAAARK